MRLRFLLSFLMAALLCSPTLASAQAVPATTAETLTGKKIVLPDAIRGHVSVFVVGFSRKSKDPTTDWNKQIRQALGQDHNLQIYQVAHLQGAPRFIHGMIVSGIRKGVPPDQQDNFFVLYEGQDAWKQWAAFSEPDDAYLVLVDKSGQAVWKTHGAFTQASLDQLKKQVADVETR